MGTLSITLLGRFDVSWKGQVVGGLEASKTQELLAYLLLYRKRPHCREKLTTLLWEDSAPAQAKGYLRQTLWQLQSALGDEIPLLLVESDWIQIDEAVDLCLDVDRFENAYAQAEGIQGGDLNDVQATALQDGVELYCGDLLENWYHEWCLFERERLQNVYLSMLEKLIGYCQNRRRYDAGTAYATEILRYDPAHERTYRRLMRLHYLAGNRTIALRTYERCKEALEEELSVSPGRRTIALREQIRSDENPAVDRRQGADSANPHMLDRLLYLQDTLSHAQQQVAEEIEVVRAALRRQ